MGGNRVGVIRWIFNILVVWLFTGLWHGAGWNFVVWGFYFAVFLVIEKLVRKVLGNSCGNGFIRLVLGHVYVVFAVMVSFLIFNADSLKGAWSDITSLFGARGILDSDSLRECAFVLKNRLGILVIGIIGATPVPVVAWRFVRGKLCDNGNGLFVRIVTVVHVLALFVVCTAYIIDGSFNPFLYFRF
jgi:alginate O-acetyltransferase complex protein AlgI